MDIKCPVCNQNVTGERLEDLSPLMRAHLIEEHAFPGLETEEERQVRTFKGPEAEALSEESRLRKQEVAQFKEARIGETVEEKEVETFSKRNPYGGSEDTRDLVEKVAQFRYPTEGESKEQCEARTFSESECVNTPGESRVLKNEVGRFQYPRTGPEGERGPFQCPVCGVPMESRDEEGLSNELKGHFVEVHEKETVIIKNR
ncbi:MAG: hypothetical protein SA339_04175 [Methanomassiliicoccus sp.]|nr:hypothetical protein [Methanomassiliicoccus sp.]